MTKTEELEQKIEMVAAEAKQVTGHRDYLNRMLDSFDQERSRLQQELIAAYKVAKDMKGKDYGQT